MGTFGAGRALGRELEAPATFLRGTTRWKRLGTMVAGRELEAPATLYGGSVWFPDSGIGNCWGVGFDAVGMVEINVRSGSGSDSSKPVLGREKTGVFSRILMFLFGSVFLSIGSIFLWISVLQPILKSYRSGEWPTVPATVVRSELEERSDSEGTTYRILIEMRYVYEGKEYTGGSFNFNNVASSGRDSKMAVLRDYPVGKETICYVNPDRPEEAVLSRKIPGMTYLMGLFASVFVLIGGGVLLAAVFANRKGSGRERGQLRKKTGGHAWNTARRSPELRVGEILLQPETGRLTKLIAVGLFGLFWNGFVWFALWEMTDGFSSFNIFTFFTLFMIPFVLVGIGFMVGTVHQILALFNPVYRLLLPDGYPRLGDELSVRWSGSGSVGRVDRLEFRLEGVERATYRRGTDTETDTSLFFRETLFDREHPGGARSGEFTATIPADLMCSLDLPNNEIRWQIRVHGKIRMWPDVDETYPLTVRPLPEGGV